MNESIFTKIINRDVTGYFVYEDEVCVAILDIAPAVSGQTLVIPKVAVDYIFALDDDTFQHCLAVAKQVALALDTVFDTERTCMVIEGFEVPHAHIKLYPVPDRTPLGQVLPTGSEADAQTLAAHATAITAALSE